MSTGDVVWMVAKLALSASDRDRAMNGLMVPVYLGTRILGQCRSRHVERRELWTGREMVGRTVRVATVQAFPEAHEEARSASAG
jgi:hypothetical protein